MNRRRNSSGLRWHIHCFKIVTRSRLWSTVSKRGIHLANSFFISNCSCKIEITVPCVYTYGLNKLAHFHSSISQNNIVDFIDDFWRSSLNWTSRTKCITCGCTTTFKFIHPIVYSCKCTMLMQMCYEYYPTPLWFLSALNLSYVDVWSLHKTRFFSFCKKYKGCSL